MTNKQAAGIVRGYGGQELNSCLERLMCAVMKKGNFDPLDVFKKNYIAPGDRFIWRDGRVVAEPLFPVLPGSHAERGGPLWMGR